jgi:DNA-binding winged helix-turn-helix (wHTH) protein/TolB-like protein/Flp pilus assembly protein TadD
MSSSIEFGPYRLDPAALVLWRGEAVVPLPPKALLLLRVLVEHAGEAVPKPELMTRVWPDAHVHSANLSVTVAGLRKALGEQPGGGSYVQTLARRGYRFAAPLKGGAPAPVVTLAVLPFQGIGAFDPHLGLGLADALIARLTGVETLRVRPTGAIAHYAASPRPPQPAAEELAVDAVLDGTFQIEAGRVRVSVQLVPRSARLRPWAQRFEGAADDLFALQDEVAERIAAALQARLPATPAGTRHEPRREAREAYLRGRYFLARLDLDGITKAFGHLGEAAQLDPEFAAARAGLASAHLVGALAGLLSPGQAWRAAGECAGLALALDPASIEARVASAFLALFRDLDWSEARRGLADAVACQPGAPGPRLWLGLVLGLEGDRNGARREVALAREADPLSPLGLAAMSLIHELDGDLEPARLLARRTVEMYPDRFLGHWRLGALALRSGTPAEAVAPLRRTVELTQGGPAARCALARALAGAGEAAEARQLLEAVEALAATAHVSACWRGIGWWQLGEPEKAAARFEEAVAERDPWLVFLRPDPLLRVLRCDQRLRALLRPVVG